MKDVFIGLTMISGACVIIALVLLWLGGRPK